MDPIDVSMSDRQKPHFAYIECVRGYAILLVIICHATYLFPGLPYPVHRITVFGWHGVQLFFLASAVTLMMSWHYEKTRDGGVNVGTFFLRRFFRIAPAYYLAAIAYFLLEPPVAGFDQLQSAATLLFVNAWHPTLMGVTSGAWSVVPGGWSIGVEFTFYAVFPILACTITSLSRAVWLLLGTLLVGLTLNSLLLPSLDAKFGTMAANNFLYFWFPNQMSVFALGLCLYFLLERDRERRSVFSIYPNVTAGVAVVMIAGVAFIATPQWLNWRSAVPPGFLLVSLALMIFIMALARAGHGIFINGPAALMGWVSFSAYLLHAALLKIVSGLPFLRTYFDTTGWLAIPAFAAALLCIVAIVLAGSWCTYRAIEMPMIGLGKTLLRQRRLMVAVS